MKSQNIFDEADNLTATSFSVGKKMHATFAGAAEEAKSLTVRPDSVVEFFAIGEMWGNRTLFNEVIFSKPQERFIYSPDTSVNKKTHVDSLANALREILRKANEEKGELCVGLSLSGGLDSRTLIAAAPQGLISETFTFGEKTSDDVRLAKKIADRLGSPKHTYYSIVPSELPKHYREVIRTAGGMWGISQSFALPVYKDIEKRLDIVMDGYGTDAMLGGNAILIAQTPEEYLSRRRMFGNAELIQLLNDPLHGRVTPVLRKVFGEEIKKLRSENVLDRTDELSMNAHVMANNIGYVIPRQYVRTFSPHAHPAFYKKVQQVPANLRAWHRIYGPFIEELSKEAARVPYAAEFFPPTFPSTIRSVGRLYVSARRRAIRLAGRIQPKIIDKHQPYDFRGWWHTEPKWRKSIENALYLDNQWLRQDEIDRLVAEQEQGKNHVAKLLHIATFKLTCNEWE